MIIKMLPKGFLPSDQHYLRLAKKPISAGVVYFNKIGQILLVKQTYSDYWTVPGGSADNLESPHECAAREVLEELGISLPVKQLLLIQYIKRDGLKDYLHFIFYGGVITDKTIQKVVLQAEEIVEYGFFNMKQVRKLINPRNQKRIKYMMKAISEKRIYFFEN